MDIDWFTFGAQIFNFLVLVGLLRWLLYDPIIKAMNEREQKIADRLSDANNAHRQAEQKKEEFEEKSRDIEQRRRDLLEEAEKEATEQRKRLMHQAREDVDNRRGEWTDAFKRDQHERVEETRREITKMAIIAARKTLEQLADVDLQSRMCHVLSRQLSEMDSEQRIQIAEQLTATDDPIIVRSALKLCEEDRKLLQDIVRETLSPDADLQFETDAEMICGVELVAGGFSISWNAVEVLRELARDLSDEVKHEVSEEVKTS